VVVGLQARDSRNFGSILREATSFFFSKACRLTLQANYPPILYRKRALSPVSKAANECSVEIKNEWRNTSTPMYVYGVQWHNSYFQKITGCTCRTQEKRYKLFQANNMKRTKALM
jgi:hypothetical protein